MREVNSHLRSQEKFTPQNPRNDGDVLRMIRVHAKVGEEQLFSAWPVTVTVGLNRNEYRVDFVERPWIIKLQDPAFLSDTVFVENL